MFAGTSEIDGSSTLDIDRLAFLVCRGGWPQAVDMREEIALDQAMDYYDAVVHSDTRYYVDPSITAAALGIGPNDLINDLKTFGFLLETLCVRDLRVFADAINGEVYHYRDKDGQECDAVIHLRNGKYGLIEIKLDGDRLIEEGAKNLKAMEAKIDTGRMNAPSFLMVLTGIGDYAYRRQDGVFVVPIGCLKN